MKLAEAGLTEKEITAELGCKLAEIEALSELIQRGNARGTAALKRWTFKDAKLRDGLSRRYLLDTLAEWSNGSRPRHLQMSELRQEQLEEAKAKNRQRKPTEEDQAPVLVVNFVPGLGVPEGDLGLTQVGRETKAPLTPTSAVHETSPASVTPARTTPAGD